VQDAAIVMGAEGPAREENAERVIAKEFISDAHHSISSTDCLSRLRDVLNEAVGIAPSERGVWLEQNVSDPEERQAIATLLFAHDSDGFIEVESG
jgi:hypothetical protein